MDYMYWVPRGTQEEGTGRCRERCPFGCIGEKGRWVHEWSIGQESHRVKGGRGRKSNKGAVPRDLHKEICRVRQARCRVKKDYQYRRGHYSISQRGWS